MGEAVYCLCGLVGMACLTIAFLIFIITDLGVAFFQLAREMLSKNRDHEKISRLMAPVKKFVN